MVHRITHIRYSASTKETSEWRPYQQLWHKYGTRAYVELVEKEYVGIEYACDPFARNCQWAEPWTNDINIDTKARWHLDAEEFLTEISDERFAIMLLDPPFSDRMSKDKYGTKNLYASDSGKMLRIQIKAGNLVVPGGYFIKAGYNTNKPHPCFDLIEVRIVAMGNCRNDVLFSVWQKNNYSLEDFE
jgi:hypothetical protein